MQDRRGEIYTSKLPGEKYQHNNGGRSKHLQGLRGRQTTAFTVVTV
jgi:hypothetical protein